MMNLPSVRSDLARVPRSVRSVTRLFRQQLVTLTRRHHRPRLTIFDRVFWILAHRFWSAWKQVLIVVTPETVVQWHRAGFRSYWSAISLRHRQTWAAGPRKSVLYKIVWKRKVRSGKRRYL